MSTQNQSDSQNRPSTVNEIIAVILEKSSGGNYIFRGESKCYEKVSSGLYRAYSSKRMKIRDQDIAGAIQASEERMLRDAKAYLGENDYAEILAYLKWGIEDTKVVPNLRTILKSAQKYLGETEDFKILAQLQHYGLATNLIDFTHDYLVALFFASYKDLEEDGRVIVLDESTEGIKITEAPPMIDRAVFQRSVLVEAREGFIKCNQDRIVHICHTLKKPLQDYLANYHGLSTRGIYNDIHGFIRSYNIYPDFYGLLRDGQICFKEAIKAADCKEQLRGYEKAIRIFTEILGIKSNFPDAYLNRGEVHFQLGEHYMEANEKDKAKREYDKAITDYKAVITQYRDYAGAYAGRGKVYNSVGKFDAAAGDFDKAISLGIEDGTVHSDRCVSLINLGKWEELRSILTTLKNQMQKGETDEGPLNIDALLGGLAKYAKDNSVELPADIAEMLTSEGTQEEY